MDNQNVILCVDDEVNILKSLERTLRPEGYRILTACSGHDGIKILEEQSVDLVIVDERMPAMSGSEFLRIIKKKYPAIISIMVSGYSNFNSLVKAVNEGEIFRFIPKPWDTNKMREIVRLALEQEKVKHSIDDSTQKVSEMSQFPESIQIETSEDQDNVLIRVTDPANEMTERYVLNLLNYILESLGVERNERIKITSGAVKKLHQTVILTVNIKQGINLKIELPRLKEFNGD